MSSVSHKSRRTPRPWTAQDQITAEVAAACGVSCVQIGRLLGCSDKTVARRLSFSIAEQERQQFRLRRNANPAKYRERNRSYYENNKEAVLKRTRGWQKQNSDKERDRQCRSYLANREKVLKRTRGWQKQNSDKERDRLRVWRRNNRIRYLERSNRWKQNNPEKVRESARRRRATNPDNHREYNRRRAAWRRASRCQALCPVTRQQIDARFALWNNRCAFCGVDASDRRNHGRQRLTVEHVLALTKGGLDEASNIIPACSACNSSKQESPVESWYRRQQWFTEVRWRKIQRHCPAAVIGQLPLAL
jgi:hypothetical protein